MVDTKPVVFFVLGGPGSGKGTQCAKMVDQYGFAHLSAGDLLREEVILLFHFISLIDQKQRDSGSETAQLINQYIVEGKIVPVEITCQLLKKGMEKKGWAEKRFLIDGFPRNQDNFDGWDRVMGDLVEVPFVLFFDADEETMINRIMERSKTSGRNDDNIESLKKRFDTFKKETMPIVDLFDSNGKTQKINALRTIDEVFEDVKKAFEPYL
ncbi:ump-cmp kinase-like [Stylonychia lemnae]|uniref:UMP-CMP kinase n=1 Tax=Stylonychia lemnae TaxID=5949 RepID=A0A078ARW7_STYLE|nr:ump-cmp kinase-like [Stylonychia lemnae]|eukprot:CDW84919.1 ump-cmp kinase-like [Stylonychia lemnae]